MNNYPFNRENEALLLKMRPIATSLSQNSHIPTGKVIVINMHSSTVQKNTFLILDNLYVFLCILAADDRSIYFLCYGPDS